METCNLNSNSELIKMFFVDNRATNKNSYINSLLEEGRLYEEQFDYERAKQTYKRGIKKAEQNNNSTACRLFSMMLLDLVLD